jgi:ParB family chromosome partitioning protein
MTSGDLTVERRRGLGRGLGALIPAAAADRRDGPHDAYFAPVDAATAPPLTADLVEVAGLSLREIPVEAIGPNPRQPRQVFDPDELGELAFSLREVGMLQPVVVRPVEATTRPPAMPDTQEGPEQQPGESSRTSFELVVGERRWRAAQQAGLATIPALVRHTADEQMLRDALLENLHRTQLNPLEEAAAYAQLLEEFGCTQDELSERLGRSRPQVSNTLRLLRLPAMVQRRVAAGVLSAGHARALLSLDDPVEMETLAQRIVAEGLSVRSVEEIVTGRRTAPGPRRPSTPTAVPDHVSEMAAALADRLDTRVSVAMGRRKGRLTIDFASTDDFDRIAALLGAGAAAPPASARAG